MGHNITKTIFLYGGLLIAVALLFIQTSWHIQPPFLSPQVVIDKTPITPTSTPVSIPTEKQTSISRQVPLLIPTLSTTTAIDNLISLQIGDAIVQASVADNPLSRVLGLSNTQVLPDGVVKLFVFETSRKWDFWMKDMNYPIDIIWLDEQKKVVHIEHNINPDTYPNSFTPDVPAKYVIEADAGFSLENKIEYGTVAIFQ